MSNLWEKFDKTIDVKALKEDVEAAAENSGEYREVPEGEYEIAIEKLELGESKSGNPTLKVWMKILEGEYKGQYLFYNQALNTGFGIHNANEFLRSLDSGIEVKFESFSQYNNMLSEIMSAIEGNLEYAVEYETNAKGFKQYKISDVFEAA